MILYKEQHARRRVIERTRTEGQWQYIEHYTYDVELDMDALASLAHQAAINKTGKAVDGPLKITITSRQKDSI